MAAPVVIPQTTPRLKNVLFATDFSEGSLAALPHAGGIARAFHATLHLCHIESPAPLSAGLADPHLYWAAGQDAAERLAGLRSLPVLKGLQPALLLGEGDLKNELLRIVRESDIDLLVAGTRGRTGFRKMLLGSVIEEICRAVTCPILTVGPESAGQAQTAHEAGWARAEGGTAAAGQPVSPYRRILFPTNLSELSEKAVPYIAMLAEKFGSQVIILHVLTQAGDEITQEQAVRKAMARQFAALAPYRPEFITARGNVADAALRTARECKAGLIAMGIRNAFRPGVLRERTAYRIIAGAECPVLTVR